ncbi:MAG: VWA domain-containing protein [Planctomycetes bacterium]|nr:VWA domain-containing protein [Planctomycetota bacterium]
MSKRYLVAAGSLFLFGALSYLSSADQPAAKEPAKTVRPTVEVVFCLDTTGSMGGLIDAAKQKIWTICNQIAQGTPTPKLKIGLVAYRDRGDAYVTKVFDLTDDLDSIHGQLMAMQAQGGGDFPESVNQALHESVTKIKWSAGKKTLKIIFLVGDAPPHMDYADDVKYPETCKLAAKSDIIINTIQCGNNADARLHWEKICRLAEGSYVQIDAKGGPIVAVATPYDKDLAAINAELARSTLVYGGRARRAESKAVAEKAARLDAPAAADRAGFAGKAGGITPADDLVDRVKDGKVKLESLKREELPEELRKLTLEEQKEYLKKVDARRQELLKKAAQLDKQRGAYIARKLAEDEKGRARDSFDGQVLRVLQRQAQRVNIQYGTDPKKK